MLTTYFKHPFTLNKLRSGPAGLHLDGFADQLLRDGYSDFTARGHLRGAGQLSSWAQRRGLTSRELDVLALKRFARHLAARRKLYTPAGQYMHSFVGARLFVRFLQTRGVVAASPVSSSQLQPSILTEFCHWMRTQRGVTDETLRCYSPVIGSLLHTLGERPEHYSAKALREFALNRAGCCRSGGAGSMLSALRMFLRFLSAHGRCAAELVDAIPTVAGWRRAKLPSYLRAEEFERLIAGCDTTTPIGTRDRAVLLLLVRLGLRARDIAGLKLGDVDWYQGSLCVCGKNRHVTRLPLPQDAGEAMLDYLTRHRPRVETPHVFTTTIAPIVPLSRWAVSEVVARALRRANINVPTRGAHLLRHSAATAMLRQGVPLETIGAVLRHASIETTSTYTKVDLELLRLVVQPWVEVGPC
jgi:site-specific recombinase XerD